MEKRKFLILGLLVAVLGGLSGLIFLVKNNQQKKIIPKVKLDSLKTAITQSTTASAEMLFSPSQKNVGVGEEFSLQIKIKPNSSTVRSIDLPILFPAGNIECSELSINTASWLELEKASVDNSAGKAKAEIGCLLDNSGGVTTETLVATLKCKAKKEGTFSISFDSQELAAYDGNNNGSVIKTSSAANVTASTATNPTMTSVSFTPNSISSGQTSYLKWDSTGTDKTKVTCKDGSTVINGLNDIDMTTSYTKLDGYSSGYPLSYDNLVNSGVKGPISCEFTPYSGSTKGTPMSATLTLATAATPTMTSVSFTPTSISSGQTSYLKWDSTGTDKTKVTCKDGSTVINGLNDIDMTTSYTKLDGYSSGYPLSYDNLVNSGVKGPISCEFTPYSGSTKGTPMSATLTLSTSAYSCTGTTPSNATLCSGDDSGLTADTSKTLVSACTDSTKCEYTCSTGYAYDTTAKTCKQNSTKVDGQCGTANKTYSSSATSFGSDNFCSAGTANPSSPAFPAVGSSISWACQGQNGGTDVSCSASRSKEVTNGKCGSADGDKLSSAPSSHLCSSGNASSVSGSGPWYWTCQGINGGADASCGASKISVTYSSTVSTIPVAQYSYTAKVAPASGAATNVALLLSASAVLTLGVWLVIKKIKG